MLSTVPLAAWSPTIRDLPFSRYVVPGSWDELWEALGPEQEAVSFLAGGTDLLVSMREKGLAVGLVIDIKRLPAMAGIEVGDDGSVVIGAATTLSDIVRSPVVRAHAPALVEAAAVIGSEQVRNRATLGGNVANASPAADTAAPLLALDARLRLVSRAGSRDVDVDTFWTGPGASILAPGELVRSVILPPVPFRTAVTYEKAGPRAAMDIAVVGVAVAQTYDAAGLCTRARVALSAVAPTPIRVPEAEQALIGAPTSARIEAAVAAVVAAARPIDDIRASATYRRRLVGVLAARAIKRLDAMAGTLDREDPDAG